MNAISPLTCRPWPDEGLRWVTEPRRHAPGLDSLLAWVSGEGASRISFHTGKPVWLRIHGRNYAVTQHALDQAEIAAITGAELGTVKSRINRGRAALRDYLTKAGIMP